MLKRPLRHLRRNVISYLAVALLLALAGGGGYAFAASKTKSITVCADKGTDILHLKPHGGRCKRGQTRVTWNQQGPQGPQGMQGPAGQAGASAASVWAQVANDGSVSFGNGLAVQQISEGTYQVTITSPACANTSNAPVMSVSDAPPANQPGAGFPTVWFGSTGINEQFMVYTGRVTSGSFTPMDLAFTVMDTCT